LCHVNAIYLHIVLFLCLTPAIKPLLVGHQPETIMTTETNPPRYADSKYALPLGPHTSLFNRAVYHRESKARLDAEFAKLTPANIAAMEQVTGWLFAGGYSQAVAL
jgi:hypothetical protein